MQQEEQAKTFCVVRREPEPKPDKAEGTSFRVVHGPPESVTDPDLEVIGTYKVPRFEYDPEPLLRTMVRHRSKPETSR